MKTEPAVLTALITSIAAAGVALLVSFGLGLTLEQQNAILGFVGVIAPVIAALIIRRQVTPNSKVVETIEPNGDRIAGEASPLVTGTVIDESTNLGGTFHEGF